MKHLHVLGFGEEAPSTIFRWEALAEYLEPLGWKLNVEPLAKGVDVSALSRADVVVLQKKIISSREWMKIRRVARRLVYDADDRIWMREGRPYRGWTAWKIRRRMKRICGGADLCLAANGVIAADLEFFGGKVEVLPMSIDPDRWKSRATDCQQHVVGWTGGPKNLKFLEDVLPDLIPVFRNHPDWKLVIHCGKEPGTKAAQIEWEPFCAGSEGEVVGRFDVGLCPLPEDPFATGKSPIKILQYWSAGAAVVASPVGAVNEWVRHEENGLLAGSGPDWVAQVCRLIEDAGLRERLARAGRSQVVESYSSQKVAEHLVRKLESLG